MTCRRPLRCISALYARAPLPALRSRREMSEDATAHTGRRGPRLQRCCHHVKWKQHIDSEWERLARGRGEDDDVA